MAIPVLTPNSVELTPAGTVVMGLSILLVLSLMIFCLWRILSESTPQTHHHAPLDIDTADRE